MMNITVPTIACEGCIETLSKAIQKLDATATIQGDIPSKSLSIQTQVSEADVKAAIKQVGHEYS